ncbi:hypothetical protein [Paenibacillus sp. YYML68]|uniref:hypothetical protein n=1 Tax=Paenibacillus sp. YYML68 TaxID=2909250 RepID=UPI002492325C|nr:hypothetical protein [Paenibacillus sp. YYML68]
MGKDIIDVYVSGHVKDDEAVLVLDGYCRTATELMDVQIGEMITLTCKDRQQRVRIAQGDADECAYPYLEVSPTTAMALGLKDMARYRVDYDAAMKQMTLHRAPVSGSEARLQLDPRKSKLHRLSIGPALAARLGLWEKPSSTIVVSNGQRKMKARLHLIPNEISEQLKLSAGLCRELELPTGTHLTVQYNQRSKTLLLAHTSVAEEMGGVQKTHEHMEEQDAVLQSILMSTGWRRSHTTAAHTSKSQRLITKTPLSTPASSARSETPAVFQTTINSASASSYSQPAPAASYGMSRLYAGPESASKRDRRAAPRAQTPVSSKSAIRRAAYTISTASNNRSNRTRAAHKKKLRTSSLWLNNMVLPG